MKPRTVSALTFDLWDTLVIDDSDEARRSRLGLPSKAEARVRLVEDAFARRGLDRPRAREALATASAWCREEWEEQAITPALSDRLAAAYEAAGLKPDGELDALIHGFATMEVLHPPEPAPGVHEALELLSSRFPLGIVSDAVVTPGRELRRILQQYGLLHYFQVCVFSDEAGRSKPHASVFHRAAAGLGVPVGNIAHVGDRVDKDVEGIESVGGVGVLYTGVRDRGRPHQHCVSDLRDLPGLIARLESP